MDIYRLHRRDKGTDRVNQVLEFVDTYMGQTGLDEVKTFATLDNLNNEVGKFATSVTPCTEYIDGILLFENGFGSLIDGIITMSDGTLKKLTSAMRTEYFDLAVELNDLYHDIDPYNDSNTVLGCLDLIKNHPEYVINGLIEELREREV